MKKTIIEAITLAGFVYLLTISNVAQGSDGEFDVNDEYPAIGLMAAVITISGEFDFSGMFCSGTLISPDTYLTAGHCLFYDTRREIEIPGYAVEYWISFDSIVDNNDFSCFLHKIGHPNAADVYCDLGSVNEVTFHEVSERAVHPDYASIIQKGDGTLNIKEMTTKHNIDLAVLLLETPINNITPMVTAPLGTFDDKQSFKGTPLVDVGYGYDFHKFIPATPEQPHGSGPTTYQGDYGIRRIAELGTLSVVSSQTIVPTSNSALGGDSLCNGDSGSPLLVKNNGGSVVPIVSGVLSGSGSAWCMGIHEYFYRVDTLEAVSFLSCVAAASTTQEACECGIEDQLGLCGD